MYTQIHLHNLTFYFYFLFPVCNQFSRGVFSMLGAVSPDSFDTLHSYSNTFQMPFVTPWFPEKVNFITHFIVQSFSTTEIYLFCFKFWLQHFRYFLLLFLITLCNQICDCLQEITNCSHSKQISILFLYFNLFNIFKVVVILQMLSTMLIFETFNLFIFSTYISWFECFNW